MCYLPRGPTIRRWGFAPEPASTCAPSNTLCHRDRISAILDFEFALPEIRVLDVASGLKYSMRIWEHEDPWLNGACFSRGYARFVTLADREISALVDTTILRDTVSEIAALLVAADE